jgi:hypothetical protein
LQNITASAVSVGTNTIILNTATPILQFGGISVFDSGSTQGRSGSLLWNSINDHWINVNPSGSDEGYNSAMVINGPKNTGSLGNETGLTTNYIPVSQGEDHITDSIIFQSGSVNIGIGTNVPAYKLDVNAVNSNDGLRVQNSGTSKIIANGDGVLSWGSAADYGALTWDTGFARVNAFSSYDLRLTTSAGGLLILKSGGNVGIGITSPSERLHLNNSSGTGTFVRFQDTGGGGVYIGGRNETMELYAGGTERMRITGGAGNDLVIGFQGGNPYTAASRGSIFLNGSSNSLYGWGTDGTARGYMYHSGTNVFLENSVSGNSFNILQVGAGTINFSTNGATRMSISSNGAVVAGFTLGNQYSQTSSTGTTSIIDTGITYNTGDYGGYGIYTAYMVSFTGNPNNGGSGAYTSQNVGIIIVYTGWNGSAVTTYIQYTQLASGSNVGTLTLTPHFWNGSSQVTSIGVYTTGYQIRLRIDGYNSSFVGANQLVYLTRLS